MERAKELIDKYCLQEFQINADFDNMEDIGVCYTTTDDDDEVQVSIDLVHYAVKFYINNELKHTDRYDSIDEFINCDLEYLSFDDLYNRALEAM